MKKIYIRHVEHYWAFVLGKVEKNSKTKLMLKNGDSKVDNEIRDYNSSEALK